MYALREQKHGTGGGKCVPLQPQKQPLSAVIFRDRQLLPAFLFALRLAGPRGAGAAGVCAVLYPFAASPQAAGARSANAGIGVGVRP